MHCNLTRTVRYSRLRARALQDCGALQSGHCDLECSAPRELCFGHVENRRRRRRATRKLERCSPRQRCGGRHRRHAARQGRPWERSGARARTAPECESERETALRRLHTQSRRHQEAFEKGYSFQIQKLERNLNLQTGEVKYTGSVKEMAVSQLTAGQERET